MDIVDEELFSKKCYKFEEPVLDNLDIVYNSSNSKLFLWNKYQIFMYENTEIECLEKTFIPEFQVQLVIASNNYLLNLDCNGNVHITSLKFKSSTPKCLKFPTLSQGRGIKSCVRYKDDHTLSLKYEADAYFLCLNRINIDFYLEKQIILLCNDEHWPLGQNSKEKYLLATHAISEQNLHDLNKIFKLEESTKNVKDLVVLSFDKHNIYGCLFSPKMTEEEVTLVKLYSSPAEICNMEIVESGELYLLIGLNMGTIIRLSLHDSTKTPDFAHLNTAVHKMLVLKDHLIYTDGTTMWKAECAFSDSIKFTQFFLKNVKDFVKCGDQIICTTFSKLIYKFSLDDRHAYLIPKTDDEYCSAEKLFNNSVYLDKIFEEINKNNELVKKLLNEKEYITALSLSKRQDVVNKAIDSKVMVFETYEELINTQECTLTEEIKEYFAPNSWCFLVIVTNSSIYDALNSIITNLSESIRIYVTISTAYKILKTTCIKMAEPLKTIKYLIPHTMTNIPTEINVNIKLVVEIPGALDRKKSSFVLYRKDIILKSEHFIKTSHKTAVKCLEQCTESIDELIQEFNTVQYGNLFEFTDLNKLKASENEWTFYVKLPNDFQQIFKTEQLFKSNLNTEKTNLIIQQLNAEEFLKSKKHINISIGNENLILKIQNDGFTNPLLKVTSYNAKVTYNLRNFFANLIYQEYENYEPGWEFITYSFYTTTENFQKAVKEWIKSSASLEEFHPLMEKFEKNIMGALPL